VEQIDSEALWKWWSKRSEIDQSYFEAINVEENQGYKGQGRKVVIPFILWPFFFLEQNPVSEISYLVAGLCDFRPILVLPPTDIQITECEQSEAEHDFYDALFRRSKVSFFLRSFTYFHLPYIQDQKWDFIWRWQLNLFPPLMNWSAFSHTFTITSHAESRIRL